MTLASITPFAAAAASLPPQNIDAVPALEDIQRDLDELLMLWDCAITHGEDITRNRLLRRGLEDAANKLDTLCEQLREAGHE